MTKIKQYPSYKDTGIEWIGKIPEEWDLKMIKHLLNERNEKNNPIKSRERLSLSIDKGVTLYSEKTTNLDRFKEDFTQYKLAYKGDLVLNSMNMIVGAVGVSKYFGCVSPVYYVYYDNDDENTITNFCEYFLKIPTVKQHLKSLGKGIMSIEKENNRINTCRLKISRDDLKNMYLPQPNLKIQKNIVNFLDNSILSLNKKIEKNKKLIELLKEKRASLINQTVTKGLNPNTPMKESGIEWIGKIPEHWKISKMKYYCDISMGQSPDSKYYTDDENYTIFIQGNADLHEGKVIPRIYTKQITKKANINDLLLTVRAPCGDVAISKYPLCIGRGVSAISNANNRKFLFYYLINLRNNNIWELVSNGSTFESINYEDITNMTLIEPSAEEQEQITKYLDNQTQKIDKTIEKIERNIELLEEYKESLIHHLVTGKIDVRSVEI